MSNAVCVCQGTVTSGPSTHRVPAHFDRRCPHSELFRTTRRLGDRLARLPARDTRSFAAMAADRRARTTRARPSRPLAPLPALLVAEVRAELTAALAPKSAPRATEMPDADDQPEAIAA